MLLTLIFALWFFAIVVPFKKKSLYHLLPWVFFYSAANGFIPTFFWNLVPPPIANQSTLSPTSIVVFGGGLRRDQEDKLKISDTTQARLLVGINELHNCRQRSSNCTLIVSGGDPQKLHITEAELMRNEAIGLGVDPDLIVADPTSNTTWDTVRYTLKNTARPFLVVSSRAHMRRILSMYQQFDDIPAFLVVDDLRYRIGLMAHWDNLASTYSAIYECAAFLKHWIFRRGETL